MFCIRPVLRYSIHMPASKKAIIIGATSGIGLALARVLAAEGYELGLTGRRIQLLESLKSELGGHVKIGQSDVKNPNQAITDLEALIAAVGGADLIILNAGVNHRNPDFTWKPDEEVIETNTVGFAALAGYSIRYFLKQGFGHLTGISSIAGDRGSGKAPVYSATKAFASTYLEGIRQRLSGKNITVTDIRPGFVDTAMVSGIKTKFWVASPEKAALQIYDAILKRKKICYVTKRWAWVSFFYKLAPAWLCDWGYRVWEKRENTG